MGTIGFDHSYTEDIGHKFFKALGRAGFALPEHKVEHPGKNFCRFIYFKDSQGKRVYLEFVHVGRGGERVKVPGVSLRYGGRLKGYFSAIRDRRGVKANYRHKNYDWKKDDKSLLPGWNFLTFKEPKFRNFYLWFTEYERRPRKKSMAILPHRNTAESIYGLQVGMSARDRVRLARVVGKSLAGAEVSLGGAKLFIKPAASTRVQAIVVSCRDIERFAEVSGIKKFSIWNGRKAVIIKNPARRMWDIVVVEQK